MVTSVGALLTTASTLPLSASVTVVFTVLATCCDAISYSGGYMLTLQEMAPASSTVVFGCAKSLASGMGILASILANALRQNVRT